MICFNCLLVILRKRNFASIFVFVKLALNASELPAEIKNVYKTNQCAVLVCERTFNGRVHLLYSQTKSPALQIKKETSSEKQKKASALLLLSFFLAQKIIAEKVHFYANKSADKNEHSHK